MAFAILFLITNQMTVVADQSLVVEYEPPSSPDFPICWLLVYVAAQRVINAWDKQLEDKTLKKKKLSYDLAVTSNTAHLAS